MRCLKWVSVALWLLTALMGSSAALGADDDPPVDLAQISLLEPESEADELETVLTESLAASHDEQEEEPAIEDEGEPAFEDEGELGIEYADETTFEYIDDHAVRYQDCMDGCATPLAPCLFFPSGGMWVHGEYLLWSTKGMEIPPLVTAGPTGILGDQGTELLYGDETILDDMRSGFRIEVGTWLDCNRIYGLEGDYWSLGEENAGFRAESNAAGSPSLFRPFNNMNPRLENGDFDPPARADAEIVSEPEVLAGSVQVDAYSELMGAGIRFRRRMCCDTGCITCRDACGCPVGIPRSTRLDFLIGYRYLRLREGLSIHEDLTSLLPVPEEGSFDLRDSFDTKNTFNGVDLGILWERSWGRWSLELLGKLALGNMEQIVQVRGRTTISDALTGNGDYVGGLLAQRTNIGEYQRDVFAVAPELGITLGSQLTRHWRATCGYSFLYLSRVARPGEQVDLDVNPDLLPPEFSPFAGLDRPEFTFRDSDFWAQGLNLGLECRV